MTYAMIDAPPVWASDAEWEQYERQVLTLGPEVSNRRQVLREYEDLKQYREEHGIGPTPGS